MIRIDLNKTFEVFFDGACHLCTQEINMLRLMDRKNRLVFTDIADPGFDAVEQTGLTYETLMDAIHGRIEGETLVEGVEVFRQLYGRVGFASIIWMSRIPGIVQLLNAGYVLFAKNRLKWTGRCENGLCEVSSTHATKPKVG